MAKRLFVEVCNATNLMPKDGEGSASAYCTLEFDGQRRRTEVKSKDLSPAWNAVFEFLVSNSLEEEVLEINVFSDKKTGRQRPSFLGRVRLPCRSVVKKGEEAVVHYTLEKRSIFSHVRGELGLKIWWSDEPDSTPAAPVPDAAAAPADPPKEGDTSTAAAASDAPKEGEGEAAAAAAAAPVEGAEGEAKTEDEKKDDEKKEEEKKEEEKKGEEKKAEDASSEAAAAVEKKENEVEEEKKKKPSPPPKPTIVPPQEYTLKETRPKIATTIGEKIVTFDLVEKMQYLFIRVVKARALAPKDANGSSDPYVKISLGSHTARTRTVPKTLYPEWNEVFAFGKERMGGPALEIILWDEDTASKDDFLGCVTLDFSEIPTRVPPDSPLAPQWYRLENSSKIEGGGGRVRGDLMLAVWLGTQADEAFTEAWQSDSGGYGHTRAKVYLSPKLWYLRVNVIEAQEVQSEDRTRFPEVSVRVQLGFQVQKTRIASNRSTSPFWNEDLMFVAAEPFEEDLILRVEDRIGGEKEDLMGHIKIPLASIERRVDHRQVSSRWYNLDKGDDADKPTFHGRLHLRVCFDGGYHVLDESANHGSCTKPTAKQLWKQSIGVLELGILRAKDVLPMKNKGGRGTTDAYCVAKYGGKWVRTRTIIDSLNPRWNEQYRWDVHDPCTVLTVGMYDNCQLLDSDQNHRDARIGKVRIRLSTLESDRVYTNRYPLLMLQQSGVKKLGEIELAVRFSTASMINMMQVYFQPLLPKMHYLHPLGVTQAEVLRISAMRIVAIRLARSEPPLRQEVVQYMLDSEVSVWSLRRSKVNYFRIMNVLGGPLAIARWLDNVRKWRNPVTTVLVHVLFLILVWYPELIFPTLFLYMFLIGLWQYRYRPRSPPSMEAKLSQAEEVEPDELDEEFDPIPSAKDPNIIRARYDRIRIVAARIQNVLGDMATQGERVGALLGWRDPRATAIFVVFSLLVAVVLYVVPVRVVVVLLGMYALRHPRFRDTMPAAPINFFRRLPSLQDRIL